MLAGALIVSVVALLTAGSASGDAFDDRLAASISDDAANSALQLALGKIHEAKCEHDRDCVPTTPQERSDPPITTQDSRAAMVFAVKSALASWCELDWRRSFLPMLRFGKEVMRFDDRRLSLMTLIHGDFMARQVAFYRNSGSCPAQTKRQLDGYLPRLSDFAGPGAHPPTKGRE